MIPPTRNASTGRARRALAVALCLALVAGSAALAGCGSDSEPGKQTTPTKTSSAKAPPPSKPVPPPAAPTLGPLAQTRQLGCMNNLKQIGVALRLWSAANQGKIPETLQQLVDANFIQADVLTCPLASSDRTCDYFFAPYSPGRAAPDRIVACDLDPHGGPGGKRVVLFVDGHIEAVSAAKFEERLASKANQTVAPIFRATTKQD
jgi:prepilin-type processing-associated H-X9-DG protein